MKKNTFVAGLKEFGVRAGEPIDAISSLGYGKKSVYVRGSFSHQTENPFAAALADYEKNGGVSLEMIRISSKIKEELSIVFGFYQRPVDQSQESGPVMISKITIFHKDPLE